MTQVSDAQFDDIENVLAGAQPPLPEIINAFNDVDGSYTRLLKRVNTKPVLISKDVREFSTEDPLYIRRIDVFGESNDKIVKGLSLVIQRLDGSEFELKPLVATRTNNDGSKTSHIQFQVKCFTLRVRVKSKLPYRKLTINQISVVGYTLSQLELVSKN